MSNIEFEHSFKVTDLEPFISYCENNGYLKQSVTTQNRIVYECAENAKIIARLTTETANNKTSTTLDFKNVNKKQGDLNISTESIPLEITNSNRDAILSVLSTLNFVEAANNLRTRYVYVKGGVKFEIDDYIRPQAKVVAIEGEKQDVEKVYLKLQDFIEEFKV